MKEGGKEGRSVTGRKEAVEELRMAKRWPISHHNAPHYITLHHTPNHIILHHTTPRHTTTHHTHHTTPLHTHYTTTHTHTHTPYYTTTHSHTHTHTHTHTQHTPHDSMLSHHLNVLQQSIFLRSNVLVCHPSSSLNRTT